MAIFSRRAKPAQVAVNGAPPTTDQEAEARTQALGRELLSAARAHKTGLLSAKFYSDKLMDWSMKDQAFKVQLFRFVDTFPVLTTPEMVHDLLVDYLSQPGVKPPPGMDLALKAGGVAKSLAAKTISSQIKSMAGNFIAGVDAADALPELRRLWKDGIAFSVDLLGEACVSDAEADQYRDKYLDLVENLHTEASSWTPNERLEKDHLGSIPRVNVSIKLSSLSAKFDPIDQEGAIRDVMSRLEPILKGAKRNGVLINFDMEDHASKDLTLECFRRCCESFDFEAGIAMQAYLRSGVRDAQEMVEWSRRVGRRVTVRLVKGAYWDYETIHAEMEGWPCPVWAEKWQTDKCFEDMTDVFLDGMPRSREEGGVKLALGSHNARSIAHALAGLETRGLARESIELQMLHGMADQLKHAAGDMGLRVREYVPVGEMIPGMAYLVRRLLENTSNESWLKAGFLDDASPDELLAPPRTQAGRRLKQDLLEIAHERHGLSDGVEGVGDGRPFFTEPVRDFSIRSVREAFARAVEEAEVPVIANDRSPEQGLEMIGKAEVAYPGWRDTDPLVRSDVLVRAAAVFRHRRDEISAVIVKENGKDWRNADADVTEAIDFLEYYAREAIKLFRPRRLGRFIGELDELWYKPRGVAVVIAPWNFPLAIAAGMTSAALVTGNTVVLKPAEQTPATARILYDALQSAIREVGASPDVLQFCPAPGETTGAALVRDSRVETIAFTGSRAVGLDIIQSAASADPAQTHVKQVIAEMGGKNAIIVDASADLDEAVLGVRASAFGFQGQKCSACSRCIVVDPEGPEGRATKTFLDRLVNSTNSLVIGDPRDPGTDIGPIIDQEAAGRIRVAIEQATEEVGPPALAMQVPEGLEAKVGKPYVGPHIFAGVERHHQLAIHEIFGPVLAVMHASSFTEALEIANDHTYKLTGGVFTRKPSHIELAKQEFRVGNLYINRSITGALVGRHPFGGFGMSGVGSKAGGPDYLLQFVLPRACAENTMRRGFAPEL